MKVKFTDEEIKILQQAMEILGMRLNNETPPPVECTEIANLSYIFEGTQTQVEEFVNRGHRYGLQPTEIIQNHSDFVIMHTVLYENLTATEVKFLENMV